MAVWYSAPVLIEGPRGALTIDATGYYDRAGQLIHIEIGAAVVGVDQVREALRILQVETGAWDAPLDADERAAQDSALREHAPA